MNLTAREKAILNFGWKFHLGDISLNNQPWWGWLKSGTCNQSGARAKLDDSNWKEVNLPHDFVIDGNYTPTWHEGKEHGIPEMWSIGELNTMRGSLKGDIAWYRKMLSIPESDRGRRIYIQFDGVYRDCKVYLNDFYVGSHLSGYTSFYFDITDFIDYGGENLLAVKVDAREYEGWYYEGGGIYRNVWMIKTSPVHVTPWGTYIMTDIDLSSRSAKLTIRTELSNKDTQNRKVVIVSKVMDPEGREVACVEDEVFIESFGDREFVQHTNVDKVKLWSLEETHLYKLKTMVYSDGYLYDDFETTFGIRDIKFDKDKGFLLNGSEVKIKGVCCHQDHAGVGVAIPDKLYDFRLKRLKESGCNAYRTTHHAPAPALLDACDRLGMLVMCENRLFSSSEEDIRQLRSLVKRDRNHPSVIIWCLGNEEGRTQLLPQGVNILKSMRQTVRSLDSTRPVTLGIILWNWMENAYTNLERVLNVADELDIMGFNYAEHEWEHYRSTRNDRAVIITEASSSLRTRGCYEDDEQKCHCSGISKREANVSCVARVEVQVKKMMENPYICGGFIWTGFDYYGEPVPFEWPAISSQFGILDLCGFPKDNFYYFKSWWSDAPVLHIAQSWTRPEEPGKRLLLAVYSNCEEVELFVNQKSLGRKRMKKYSHLEWENVIYEKGTLYAQGYVNGRLVAKDRVETCGQPYAIRLRPDRTEIQADNMDVVVVDVDIVDEMGRIVPYASNMLTFHVSDSAKIMGVGNGDPGSHEFGKSNYRRAFNGHCQVILQSTLECGTVRLKAESPSMKTAEISIPSFELEDIMKNNQGFNKQLINP